MGWHRANLAACMPEWRRGGLDIRRPRPIKARRSSAIAACCRRQDAFLQQALFGIDPADRIIYAEVVPDPLQEPDDDATVAAAHRAADARSGTYHHDCEDLR
jgi:hypothetical protein